jgi:hypothetical protein
MDQFKPLSAIKNQPLHQIFFTPHTHVHPALLDLTTQMYSSQAETISLHGPRRQDNLATK